MAAVDILTKQLPDYFKPIIEYQAIMQAHGFELDDADKLSLQLSANMYILTADAKTIAYWEDILGIDVNSNDSLEERRLRVLQKFNTKIPYSIGFLNDRLTDIFGENGYNLTIDPIACTMEISIVAARNGGLDLLYFLLWEVLPAHIAIISSQEVTQTLTAENLYAGGYISSTYIQTLAGGNDGTV